MIAEGMETTVYIMEVADTTNIYIPALLLHVSNEKKLRLEKFPSINSKLSIFAELLIRRQVIEKLGL